MTRLIYQPRGKAREYSPWAVNFYNGCSNKCDYCYNRHCQAKALLGKDEPTFKNGIDEFNVIGIFNKELAKYRERIVADGKGLFFNFVSDPMLEETRVVNISCILYTIQAGIPAVVLTKCADWRNEFFRIAQADDMENIPLAKQMVKFGFTLTGCDELEHGKSTNADRIKLMRKLNYEGFITWASIEPVIDIEKSYNTIAGAYQAGCREFKIGLLSGKKSYTKDDVCEFYYSVNWFFGKSCEIQWKDSVLDFIK